MESISFVFSFKALRMSINVIRESDLSPKVPACVPEPMCQASNPLRMEPDVKNNQGEGALLSEKGVAVAKVGLWL